MNRMLLLVLLAAAGTRSGTAQTPPRGSPVTPPTSSWRFGDGLIHYGRWLTGAGAVALTILAATAHAGAEQHWDQLRLICRVDQRDCAVGADGRYVDPVAESEYQATVALDHQARDRLIIGQVALAVTVGLFILDAGRRGSEPENIPLAPLEVGVDRYGAATVGLRLPLAIGH